MTRLFHFFIVLFPPHRIAIQSSAKEANQNDRTNYKYRFNIHDQPQSYQLTA
jgi:hypothetical protein